MIEPSDLWTALCLMLVLEGLIYGLFPNQMKKMVVQILDLPDHIIQNVGLLIAAVGGACLYFVV